jgi:hypothetical protein
MITVYPDFLDEAIRVKVPHFLEHFLEVLGHARHEDFSSIPRHPHEMVLRLIDDMGLPTELHRRPYTLVAYLQETVMRKRAQVPLPLCFQNRPNHPIHHADGSPNPRLFQTINLAGSAQVGYVLNT